MCARRVRDSRHLACQRKCGVRSARTIAATGVLQKRSHRLRNDLRNHQAAPTTCQKPGCLPSSLQAAPSPCQKPLPKAWVSAFFALRLLRVCSSTTRGSAKLTPGSCLSGGFASRGGSWPNRAIWWAMHSSMALTTAATRVTSMTAQTPAPCPGRTKTKRWPGAARTPRLRFFEDEQARAGQFTLAGGAHHLKEWSAASVIATG